MRHQRHPPLPHGSAARAAPAPVPGEVQEWRRGLGFGSLRARIFAVNIVAVIVASLIVDIVTIVGLIACILPGLAVLIFTWSTTVAIVDRKLSPIDGIRASFDIVMKNFGSVLLAGLTFVGLILVGALLCGVGLLVTAPVAYLFLVYTYLDSAAVRWLRRPPDASGRRGV